MMSSRHIRATKIKHASPPSAGWLLSPGLKTVVTHEHSSPTKTCTLCKSQRDSEYSKHTHTGVQCFHVHGVCVYGSCAPWHTDAFSGFLCVFVTFFLPAVCVPRSTIDIFNNTVQVLKPLFSPLQPINHYPSLQFGALQFPPDQPALRRGRMRPLGKDLIKLINLGSYYLQIGCLASKQICKFQISPLMNTIKRVVRFPVCLGICRPKWQSYASLSDIP